MYEAFFGLSEKPFTLAPGGARVFEAQGYLEALRLFARALEQPRGISLLMGGIGSGKTTILRRLARDLGADTTVGVLTMTDRTLSDPARWALLSLGQKPPDASPETARLALERHLAAEKRIGRRVVVAVDEAQNLSIAALAQLQDLCAESATRNLPLQLLLVGLPELAKRLEDPVLARFAGSVTLVHAMAPLGYAELQLYLRHLLVGAGAAREIFSRPAVAALHVFSGGVPRLVNLLGDLSLVYAYGDGKAVVDLDTIRSVVADRSASGLGGFEHEDLAGDDWLEEQVAALLATEGAVAPAVAEPLVVEPPMAEPIMAEPAVAAERAVAEPEPLVAHASPIAQPLFVPEPNAMAEPSIDPAAVALMERPCEPDAQRDEAAAAVSEPQDAALESVTPLVLVSVQYPHQTNAVEITTPWVTNEAPPIQFQSVSVDISFDQPMPEAETRMRRRGIGRRLDGAQRHETPNDAAVRPGASLRRLFLPRN